MVKRGSSLYILKPMCSPLPLLLFTCNMDSLLPSTTRKSEVKTVYLHLKRIRTIKNHIEICCGSDISGPHGVKKGNLSLKIEWLVSLFTKGMHVVICFMCFFGMLKNTPLLHNCGFRFPTTSTFPSHCQISDSPPCECLMLTLKQ